MSQDLAHETEALEWAEALLLDPWDCEEGLHVKERRLGEINTLVAAGDIRLGMTRNQVRAVLGEPDDVGGTSRKYKIPCCWKYGDVEFFWPPARSATNAEQDSLELVMVDGLEGGPDPVILLQSEAAAQP